ncbi:MAG: type IV pilin [Candidatus Nanohaloarchaea archaeon]
MRRKGISPLIAAVLLIAFTMAVASLFAQWAPQLIQNAQQDTTNTSEELSRCTGVIIEITSGDANSATIQQTSGSEPVGNVSVTWFYDDGTSPAQDYVDITGNRGAVQTPNNGNSGASLEEIRASPVNCQGASDATYTP